MNSHPSQAEFIMAHFRQHPNQELAYDDWTDELSSRYRELTGKRAYHVRSIARRLYAEGILQKIKNGVYVYDPDAPAEPRAKSKRKLSSGRPKIYNEPIYKLFKESLFAFYLLGLKKDNDIIIEFYKEILDVCRKYERVM